MLRLFFLFSFIGLTINALSAQTETSSNERLTIQELPPAEANLRRASNDIDRFNHNLAALKTAFAEKNTSRVIAYEANVFHDIRDEIAYKSANSGQAVSAKSSQIALENMNAIFDALQEHPFDLANPQAAANAFLKLDAFLNIMQSELDLLKAAKN